MGGTHSLHCPAMKQHTFKGKKTSSLAGFCVYLQLSGTEEDTSDFNPLTQSKIDINTLLFLLGVKHTRKCSSFCCSYISGKWIGMEKGLTARNTTARYAPGARLCYKLTWHIYLRECSLTAIQPLLAAVLQSNIGLPVLYEITASSDHLQWPHSFQPMCACSLSPCKPLSGV